MQKLWISLWTLIYSAERWLKRAGRFVLGLDRYRVSYRGWWTDRRPRVRRFQSDIEAEATVRHALMFINVGHLRLLAQHGPGPQTQTKVIHVDVDKPYGPWAIFGWLRWLTTTVNVKEAE